MKHHALHMAFNPPSGSIVCYTSEETVMKLKSQKVSFSDTLQYYPDSRYLGVKIYDWIPVGQIEVKKKSKRTQADTILDTRLETIIEHPPILRANSVICGSDDRREQFLYFAIDGNHRIHNLRAIGCTHVYCEVRSFPISTITDPRIHKEGFWRGYYNFSRSWEDFKLKLRNTIV